jgi:hypothetical protein
MSSEERFAGIELGAPDASRHAGEMIFNYNYTLPALNKTQERKW